MSKPVIALIRHVFAEKGRLVAFCSTASLSEIAASFEIERASGQIVDPIYQKYLKGFEYKVPERLPSAKSLLLIISAVGRSVIDLEIEGGHFEAIIPPTYGADDLIDENEALFAPILAEDGLSFTRAWVPLKSIAARCGIGRYGRDNVLRFEGMGSFARIDAWWTELSVEGEYWGSAERLPRCADCGACERACPAGCFLKEGFIINASKCLTFMNEGSGEFPATIDPSWHNAAIGCLRCQDACPENRNVQGNEIYRRFVLDRAASDALIAGRGTDGLPAAARSSCEAAIRAAEMTGCEERLGRNLRALLSRSARA